MDYIHKIDLISIHQFWKRCKNYGLYEIIRKEMYDKVTKAARECKCIFIDVNGYKDNEISTIYNVYTNFIFALQLEDQVSIKTVKIPGYSDQDILYSQKATDNALNNIENEYCKDRGLLH